MYLTRPKSSKGRSRPAVNSSLCSSPPESPEDSRGDRRPDRILRSQCQPVSQEEVLHMLQHAPAAPPLSLNQYKVLPSIERRQSEASLDENLSKISSSDDEERRPDTAPEETNTAPTTGSLLLAVRAPCGRRFEQNFEPTDSLRMVRASAEDRYGASYRGAFISTMEVPRRTFTELDVTLAQCGIVNRSLLCISQNHDSALDDERKMIYFAG
ncbi:UBX domain-containing protein 10 [Salarias fasciatus]|uniref:UBX domain-containing protein n=1 Tax=Salarias fasciatus TaxID=181472 RepID=A0A672GZ23_SALFA|nr:UBX domain-containing protein 10 [Salarias fasciatus]